MNQSALVAPPRGGWGEAASHNAELWAQGVCHHHGDTVMSRGQEEFPGGRAGKQIVMGCLTVKGLELNSPPSIAGLQLLHHRRGDIYQGAAQSAAYFS